jgi:hypothetical protein
MGDYVVAIRAPFDDPIGRDAVIQWSGGANMQLYWHTTPPRDRSVPGGYVAEIHAPGAN